MHERIVIVTRNNKLIELKNIAEEEDRFQVDPEEFYKYTNELKAIVHTHKDSCEPSLSDLQYMSLWEVPWIICSKKCVKAYLFTALGILEIDVNSLIPKELHNLLMKLLQ